MPMGELLRPRSFRQTRVIAAVHPFFVNQQLPCKARFLRKCLAGNFFCRHIVSPDCELRRKVARQAAWRATRNEARRERIW